MIFSPVLLLLLVAALYLLSAVKVLNEYERGVIFRLGKLFPQPKGPGLVLVFFPIVRRLTRTMRSIGKKTRTRPGPFG